MLEEPFWLGLLTVMAVMAILSLIYCLKKKFAEQIERFFAEEIERSKCESHTEIPRLTGLRIDLHPIPH